VALPAITPREGASGSVQACPLPIETADALRLALHSRDGLWWARAVDQGVLQQDAFARGSPRSPTRRRTQDRLAARPCRSGRNPGRQAPWRQL